MAPKSPPKLRRFSTSAAAIEQRAASSKPSTRRSDSSQQFRYSVAQDAGHALRQIGVVDAQGRSAAWSGEDCTPWFGQIVEPHMAVQGNMLVGKAVLLAMAAAFRASEELDLDERMLCSLEAGDTAGGDKRGRQSAALKLYHQQPFPLLDVRVDEHPDPVTELRRVHTVARAETLPFVQQMPADVGGAGTVHPAVLHLLALSPADRAALRKPSPADPA